MKIGDSVRVTQRYDENIAMVGDMGELVEIDDTSNIKYCLRIFKEGRYCKSWCIDVEPVVLDKWHGNVLNFRFL